MRRALIVLIVPLILVPVAKAHVTITPTHVTPGSDVLLTFVVPNETPSDEIRGVTIVPPRGFEYEAVEGPPGFSRASAPATGIVWEHGRIEAGRFATFGVSGTARASAATLSFRVYERYRSGRVSTYQPRLVVAETAATRDRSTHTLAKAALFVGIAAAAIAVVAFFLALAHWLRGPEELREG